MTPFGIDQTPASLFFQNGPPGCIRNTSIARFRLRYRRMPALRMGIDVPLGRNGSAVLAQGRHLKRPQRRTAKQFVFGPGQRKPRQRLFRTQYANLAVVIGFHVGARFCLTMPAIQNQSFVFNAKKCWSLSLIFASFGLVYS